MAFFRILFLLQEGQWHLTLGPSVCENHRFIQVELSALRLGRDEAFPHPSTLALILLPLAHHYLLTLPPECATNPTCVFLLLSRLDLGCLEQSCCHLVPLILLRQSRHPPASTQQTSPAASLSSYSRQSPDFPPVHKALHTPSHNQPCPDSFCFTLAICPPATAKMLALLQVPCLSELCSFLPLGPVLSLYVR